MQQIRIKHSKSNLHQIATPKNTLKKRFPCRANLDTFLLYCHAMNSPPFFGVLRVNKQNVKRFIIVNISSLLNSIMGNAGSGIDKAATKAKSGSMPGGLMGGAAAGGLAAMLLTNKKVANSRDYGRGGDEGAGRRLLLVSADCDVESWRVWSAGRR